tara:strand:+ start:12322 stop:12753 length:432 start_codon:yes stop_codon:yes gene_type:complete
MRYIAILNKLMTITCAAALLLMSGCATFNRPHTTDAELQAMYVEVKAELQEMGLTLDYDTPVFFAEPGELGRRTMAMTGCISFSREPIYIKFAPDRFATRDIMAHELIHTQECLDGTLVVGPSYYESHANVREVLAIWSAKYQ